MTKITNTPAWWCPGMRKDIFACGAVHTDRGGITHFCNRIDSSTAHFTDGHLCGCRRSWE